jgi:hypothetical protein
MKAIKPAINSAVCGTNGLSSPPAAKLLNFGFNITYKDYLLENEG